MKQRKCYPVAKSLSESELENLLLEIGKNLKSLRQKRTVIERLSIEISLSKSQIIKYEAGGGNMLLTTFLKLLHGLDSNGYEFFKDLQKNK